MRQNEYGQSIGDAVEWTPRAPVQPVTLVGRWCRVEPYRREHLAALHTATAEPPTWTYLAVGPFADAAGLGEWLDQIDADPGWVPHVVCTPDGAPQGIASYLRMEPEHGVAEVGGIVLGGALQRTTAATEALSLMIGHVLDDLGYRRFEWKCDSANEPSRRAAARLGFTYEGRFRQAQVYKGRNRDTDWFSITDGEWPQIRAEHARWLDPANFDEAGRQRTPLRIS